MIFTRRLFPLYLFISVILGIGVGFFIATPMPLFALLLCSVLSLLVLMCLKRAIAPSILCLALSCMALYTFYLSLPIFSGQSGRVTVEATVLQDVRKGAYNASFIAEVHKINGIPMSGKAYCSTPLNWLPSKPLNNGTTIQFNAQQYEVHKNQTDNSFYLYLKQHNITHTFSTLKNIKILSSNKNIKILSSNQTGDLVFSIRHKIQNIFSTYMPSNEASVATGLLFSHRSEEGEVERKTFQELGIAHIFAVSGLHLSLIALLVFSFFKRFNFSHRFCYSVSFIVILCYAWLSGFSPATLRAVLMFALSILAYVFLKPYHSMIALSWAGIIILIINPFYVFSASFILSFSAFAGIAVVGKRLQRFFARFQPNAITSAKVYTFFANIIALTLGAQLGVLLPTLYFYGQINLLSIFYNILLIPFVSFLLPFLLATLCFSFLPVLNIILFKIAHTLLSFLLYAVRLSHHILPFSLSLTSIVMPIAFVGIVLLLCKGIVRCSTRMRVFLILCLAIGGISAYIFPLYAPARYTQLNVGNAECGVLEYNNHTIVIDTGKTGYELLNFLNKKNKSIDALFITQFDLEHCGGLRLLLNKSLPIKKIYVPDGALSIPNKEDSEVLFNAIQSHNIPMEFVSKGFELNIQNLLIRVLFPFRQKNHIIRNVQDTSLVLSFHLNGTTMLLMSNLPHYFEHYITQRCDIIKIANSSSKASTSVPFLTHISPQCALIASNNANNAQQSPVIRRLNDLGIHYYNTAKNSIGVEFLNHQFKVLINEQK